MIIKNGKMKKPDYFTRAFADLLMKRLLWPEEVKRCAGPGVLSVILIFDLDYFAFSAFYLYPINAAGFAHYHSSLILI